MLNQSLIEHRTSDLRETGFKSEEYNKLSAIAYQVYQEVLKFIPKEKHQEFDKIMFEYDLATENAEFIFVIEAYKQGLIDGMELSKLLN